MSGEEKKIAEKPGQPNTQRCRRKKSRGKKEAAIREGSATIARRRKEKRKKGWTKFSRHRRTQKKKGASLPSQID